MQLKKGLLILVVLVSMLFMAAVTQVDLLTQVKANCNNGVLVYIVGSGSTGQTACDNLLVDSGTTLTYSGTGGIATTGGIGLMNEGAGTYSQLTSAITCNSTNKGIFADITDASTTTWGATVTGGGTPGVDVKVYCDGSNWTVFAK